MSPETPRARHRGADTAGFQVDEVPRTGKSTGQSTAEATGAGEGDAGEGVAGAVFLFGVMEML